MTLYPSIAVLRSNHTISCLFTFNLNFITSSKRPLASLSLRSSTIMCKPFLF